MKKKKILAFAGSNSKKSINKEFVKFVSSKLDAYDVEILDLNDYQMPIFSEDIEAESGVPQEAIAFRNKMHESDAIIISLAEHNGYITTALKNILDWASRINRMEIFAGKPMFLMSVSTGRGAAKSALGAMKQLVEQRYQAEVLETFSLPSYRHVFVENTLIDDLFRAELDDKIKRFSESVLSKEKVAEYR